MINPTLLFGGGFLTEHNESPRFGYDSSGITLTHTYDSFAGVTPDDLIAAGWVIGGRHWQASGQNVYSRVRLTGFSIERSQDDRFFHTVTANFAFPYSPAMNRYGETWEYLQTTEMAEIFSVTTASDQTTYNSENTGGATGLERAIGVDGDQIQGTQAYRSASALRVTKIWATMPLSSYMDAVDRLKNTVNSTAWPVGAPGEPPLRQYKAREVLFTGATTRKNNDGNIQIDYNFLTAPKQSSPEPVQVADMSSPLGSAEITVNVSKDPWDYVWYRYLIGPGASGDNDSGQMRRRISEVHVAKMYDRANFSALGLLGTI